LNPYFEHDNITLYLGDSRDVLPHLAGNAFDLALLDPPYGKGYSTGYRAGVVRSSTRVLNDHDISTLDDVISALAPTLSAKAALYCFAAPLRLDDVLPIVRRIGTVPNLLVWDKGNCTAGDLETTYGAQWEAIIYARTSRFALVGGRDRDIIRISRGHSGSYVHPTQKPVALYEYLIGRHVSSSIIDPFMGSGRSALAAQTLGRAYIGIELEEKYCELVANELSRAESVA
jgi:DNA modification methylase